MKGKLANALKASLSDEETDRLKAFLGTVPEDKQLIISKN